MANEVKTRCRNLVLGALVADAAAMGMHWIYDQDHITKLAPHRPEFRTPQAGDYDGVPAFFAHPNRLAGEQSQYGEQLLVMLRALLDQDGAFDAQVFARAFRTHFGYGGAYVGYIDHATRDTLDNMRRAEDEALRRATTVPFSGAASVTRALVTKALALRMDHSGDALREAFEEAVREYHDDDAIVAYGFEVLDEVLATPVASGAHDMQLPAIAKLPPLVAVIADADDETFRDATAAAVRTTSDHPTADAFGQVAARMMQAAVLTGDMDAVVAAGKTFGTEETTALLDDAIARRDQDNRAVTRHFGMACDLAYGVPSALHNMLSASGYTDAIRANIHAGGDNCGRAILVGAVMGAVHGMGGAQGIPPNWVDRLTHASEVSAGLDALFA